MSDYDVVLGHAELQERIKSSNGNGAATATQEKPQQQALPAEQPKLETPLTTESPKEEVKEQPVVEKIIAEIPKEEIKIPTWQEQIDKVDKKEILAKIGMTDYKAILKENGVDDFAIGAIEYYKETGNLADYLESKTVDFKAMDATEVKKYELHKKYPSLKGEEFELLYEMEVVDRYNLDREKHEADSQEAKAGLLRLRLETDETRQKLIENQAKFSAPKREEPKPVDYTEQKANIEKLVNEDTATKTLLSGKILPMGVGDDAFNYEITADTEFLIQTAKDNSLLRQVVADKDGNINLQRWFKMVEYGRNMEQVEAKLIEQGKRLGEKKEFKEQTNSVKKEDTPNQAAPGKKPILRNGIVVGFE